MLDPALSRRAARAMQTAYWYDQNTAELRCAFIAALEAAGAGGFAALPPAWRAFIERAEQDSQTNHGQGGGTGSSPAGT